MSPVVIGLIVSAIAVAVLSLLFGYEGRRGRRFFERGRTHVDFFTLKVVHFFNRITTFLRSDFWRQIIHYGFHSLLRFVLGGVKKSEKSLRTVMRANKTLAKNAQRESATRTKLEEVALHKLSTALTEKEKKERRDKTLQGR